MFSNKNSIIENNCMSVHIYKQKILPNINLKLDKNKNKI